MNLQNRINDTTAVLGQSAAVRKLLGSNAEEAAAVQQNIRSAEDRSFAAQEKLRTARYSLPKMREALQNDLDARDAALEQESRLKAYYQNLYKGIDEEGRVDVTAFRRRLVPSRKHKGSAFTSDAEEIMEEADNGKEQR